MKLDMVRLARILFLEIGIHTWSHNPLTSMSARQIVAEVQYTAAIVYATIGIVPRLFRPPYGDIDDRVRAIVNALGYTTAFWTTSPSRDTQDAGTSLDPERNTTSEAQQEIIDNVSTWFDQPAGFISLQHDLNPWTIDVALEIISNINEAGDVSGRIDTVGGCTGISQDTPDPDFVPAGSNDDEVLKPNHASVVAAGLFALSASFLISL